MKSSSSQCSECACSARLQDADEAEGCAGADVTHTRTPSGISATTRMRCSEVGLSLLALEVRKQVNCIMLQESQQLLL